jgi:hypothetical protein
MKNGVSHGVTSQKTPFFVRVEVGIDFSVMINIFWLLLQWSVSATTDCPEETAHQKMSYVICSCM